ncbi:MAG: hypothetical protein HY927_00370 [Elusimicrobia bacterium]|nr:hypothetical protein [Elusimicrobiota bacterium]
MRTPRRAAAVSLSLALLALTGLVFVGSQWLRLQPGAACRTLNKGAGMVLPSDRAAVRSDSCTLCHYAAHGSRGWALVSFLKVRLRAVFAGSLRDSLNGGAFDAGLVGRHQSLGPDSCSLCHVKTRATASKSRWAPSESSSFGGAAGDVPSTAVCLSCHDGSLAGASGFSTSGPRASSPLDMAASHPVGMSYARALAEHPGAYNQPGTSLGIRLEGGLVGCLSCHRLHGPADPRARPTVIETACESCHRR